MFRCNSNNKIYIVCPAGSRTGGLELLHQLVFTLNDLGLVSYITYINITDTRPTNPAYDCYVKEYKGFEEIEDTSTNIVIFPELLVELMSKIKKAKIVVWWLSVDNYLKMYSPSIAYKLIGVKGLAWYLKNMRWQYRVGKINNKIQYNLAQSFYAIDFLQREKFGNISFLSDYISTDYLTVKIDNKARKNVVLYNPKKGVEYSKYLMSLDPTLQWIPLINLSNDQVKELLLSSKVYVDFGNHPGKDRFPREAAFCGCCVITGRRGSAGFYKDVPIPDDFKFEDTAELGVEIIKKIKECFEHFDECQAKFIPYREMIAAEQENFVNDVRKLFLE